jgi:small subunit ribosomal protein S5
VSTETTRRDSGRGGGEGGGGDRGGDRGGRRRDRDRGGDRESTRGELIDKVIKIKRCAAVVKGGRRFSFAGMVVVGNGRGKVGWGYGKANEVPPSVEKAVKDGSRSMIEIALEGGSIPHKVEGRYGAARVVLVPAAPGTGVIAGAAVRAVCECAGIHNILTKSFGSNNPTNLVKAAIDALQQLRTRGETERLRGVTLS